MSTYTASKSAEILISTVFKDSDTATSGLICSSILNMANSSAAMSMTTIPRRVNSLLEEVINKCGSVQISSKQLLKIANGIAHREWVTKITYFHIIMAVCVLCNHKSDALEEYTNEEIMFRPLIQQYGNQNSIINLAFTRPIYVSKSKVDRIASAIMIHNSIMIKGRSGVGKRTLIMALAKQIILGEYPLLYNSAILVDPTRQQVDKYMREQTGLRIICVLTSASTEMVSTASGLGSISLAKRARFIYIVNDEGLEKYAASANVLSADKIVIDEPQTEEVVEILKAHIIELQNYIDFTIDDSVKPYIVEASNRFEGKTCQPIKSINLLTEIIFDKMNRIMAKSSGDSIPLVLCDTTTDECQSIYTRLCGSTAYEMLRSATAHIHISITDAEEYVVRRFNLTKEVLASMLSTNFRDHLSDIKNKLQSVVFGQDHVLNDVTKSLWRRALRLDKMQRPVSFMLIGFTGTGKTHLAKKLAEIMYGNESNMIRFDMSEYMERHEVSKLLGSPPGFVGSNQPGRLTDEVSKNPYAILLFDEIEKAHKDILNIFLQVFDDGRLTDNHGRTVDFTKTIIIMTSNIGCDIAIGAKSPIGFSNSSVAQKQKDVIIKEAESYFRPEFLNRLNKIMVMNPLGDNEFKLVARTRLKEILDNSILKITVSDNLEDAILSIAKSNTYNLERYNAREIKRVIVDTIENKIVDFVSENKADHINIGIEDGEIRIRQA